MHSCSSFIGTYSKSQPSSVLGLNGTGDRHVGTIREFAAFTAFPALSSSKILDLLVDWLVRERLVLIFISPVRMDMLSVPQPSAGTREGFPAFRLKELAVSADLPMLWAGNPTDVIEQLDSPQDVASLFEVPHASFFTITIGTCQV